MHMELELPHYGLHLVIKERKIKPLKILRSSPRKLFQELQAPQQWHIKVYECVI